MHRELLWNSEGIVLKPSQVVNSTAAKDCKLTIWQQAATSCNVPIEQSLSSCSTSVEVDVLKGNHFLFQVLLAS